MTHCSITDYNQGLKFYRAEVSDFTKQTPSVLKITRGSSSGSAFPASAVESPMLHSLTLGSQVTPPKYSIVNVGVTSGWQSAELFSTMVQPLPSSTTSEAYYKRRNATLVLKSGGAQNQMSQWIRRGNGLGNSELQPTDDRDSPLTSGASLNSLRSLPEAAAGSASSSTFIHISLHFLRLVVTRRYRCR